MSLTGGVLPAIVTPMNKDESLNLVELANQVNRQIDAGVHGIFCLGTNGEFYSLSRDEKIVVVETILEAVDGRIPIFAGTGCITTSDTVSLTREIAAMGVDAISVIMPYFIAVTQEQIIRHYRSIADSVDLPVLIYNIPIRTGNIVELDTVRELAGTANIEGIKDSSGDIEFVRSLINNTPDDFSVYIGTDSLVLDTLKAGGTGTVSGCANLFPGLMARIYNSWKSGDIEDAAKAQDMISTIRSLFKYGNPNSIVKRSLNLLGQPVGPAREPVNINNVETDKAIIKALEWYRDNGIIV